MLLPQLHATKIKKNAAKSDDNKSVSKLCISLREWVILISILVFIFTALVTAAMVLGTVHTGKLLDLLHDDIQEEGQKSLNMKQHAAVAGVKLNLARLQESREFIFVFNQILHVLMWIGWLNVIFSAILIYGVTTMTPRYVLPWILISMTTNIFTIIIAICAICKLIPGFSISTPWLTACFASSLLHIKLWTIIFIYYKILLKSKYASCAPIIVEAHGGYTHTITPLKQSISDIV